MSSQDASLFPFALFLFALVLWIIAVVIVLPRLLGRAVSFFTNRALGDKLRLVIHAIYVYPLAGRAVAHSVQYTVPNGTVTVEQLVLQVRWWRKAPVVDFNQLLNVDQPATLDRVAHVQQELQKENTAFFLKRPLYRLRRWWRRVAAASDVDDSIEPSALISVHCIGLRTRMVNYQSNYDLLRRVMEVSRSASRHASFLNNGVRSRDARTPTSDSTGPAMSNPSMVYDKSPSSSRSSFSSVQSVEEKPFIEKLLELTSLRITFGAFYFCDMGESPLVRLSVQSAKLRYMYGAPTCPIDKSRKRIRMRMSGLKMSVADKETVQNIIQSNPDTEGTNSTNSEDSSCAEENNTNRLIRRVLSLGYRGISETMPETPEENEFPRRSTSKRNQRPALKEQLRSSTTWTIGGKSRRIRPLPCSDVLNAEIAIIDYVFDEPGVVHSYRGHGPHRQASTGTEENLDLRDDSNPNPPPVCRVSIVLKGTSFSYDIQAIADIERVVERLQPPFFDLVPVAKRLFSREGKREATGIQITVDASPVSDDQSDSRTQKPFFSIPFEARESTWKSLQLLNIRNWDSTTDQDKGATEPRKPCFPILSRFLVKASNVSLRTEIPYEYGASQKTVVTFKDVSARAEGIVDMPIGRSKFVTLTRVVQTPQVWNDEHHVSYDILTSQTDFNFFPDTCRVIDDINATIREHSKKAEGIRYFVPYREKTVIRAEDQYCISLTCSHENAWSDIQDGIPDQYGLLKLYGTNAELNLVQVAPSSYVNNSSELHWSLSLPNLSGKISVDLSEILTSVRKSKNKQDVVHGKNSGASYFPKSRASSLAQRVLIQFETFVAHHPNISPETTSKETRQVVERTILSAGNKCELSGKFNSDDDMLFLDGPEHAFLDSVNRSEIRFTASSIVADLNPHHTSSFLNLFRNYASGGYHTISAEEKSCIEERRKPTSLRILKAGRLPTSLECLTIGLSNGLVMSSADTRNAADDVFEMSLEIDSLLLRMHELPHLLSPFCSVHEKVCSIVSSNISGEFRSNRLGSEIEVYPRSSRRQVSIFGGYLPSSYLAMKGDGLFRNEEQYIPRTILKGFRLSKRSAASPFWGSYSSELILNVDEVKGCLMDSSLKSLSSFVSSAIPHPLFEDQTAIASILSVDTMQVCVGSSDFFVLSPASSTAARRSGQRSQPMSNRAERGPNDLFLQTAVPKFLRAISHVSICSGMRFVTSTLATESLASRSRCLIQELTLEVMIPWDEKLPPWVDEATMRAQVSHATPLGTKSSSSLFNTMGVLRKIGECRRAKLDTRMEFRPPIWSSRIKLLQEGHVTALSDKFGKHIPRWITNAVSTTTGSPEPQATIAANQDWWDFVSNAKRMSISKTQKKDYDTALTRVESMSVSLPSPIIVRIFPSCVEVVNDIITRMQERLSRYKHGLEIDGNNRDISHDVDGLLTLWTSYESKRRTEISEQLLLHAPHSYSIKALETAEVSVHVLPPVDVNPMDANRFASARRGAATFVLAFPQGMHCFSSVLLNAVEGDQKRCSKQSNTISETVPGFSSMKTVSCSSIPSIVLQYYWQEIDIKEIGVAQRILFISRDHVIGNNDRYEKNYRINHQKQKNNTLICKIESFNLGSKDSSLSAYTAFGKAASVFLLMLRTLALNYGSLQQLQMEVLESVCNRYLSTTLPAVYQRNASDVYRFFVSEKCFKKVGSGVRFNEMREKLTERDPPQGFIVGTLRDEDVDCIKSMDLALRNISLKISGQELVHVNVFLCKTSSSRKPNDAKSKSRLEVVIKAAFGAVRLFMTDSMAANCLRMVSEVASFVGETTKHFPMLRVEEEQNGNLDGGRPIFVPSPQKSNKPGEDRLGSAANHSINYFGLPTGHSHILGGNTFRWSANSYRKVAYFRSRSNPRFQDKLLGGGIRNLGQHELSSHPLVHSGTSGSAFIRNSSTPTSHHASLPCDAKNNSSVVLSHSLGSRSGNTVKNDRSRMYPMRKLKSQEAETLVSTGDEESGLYQIIAETTAGETGPPRKRAKRMIPRTIVPPAFESPRRLVEESPIRKFSQTVLDETRPRPTAIPDRKGREQGKQKRNGRRTQPFRSIDKSHGKRVSLFSNAEPSFFSGAFPNVTMFLSFKKVEMQYTRRRGMSGKRDARNKQERDAGVFFLVNQPRLTLMSSTNGMCSIVLTASSSDLRSSNDPNCTMAGSIHRFGMTVSIAQHMFPRSPPKLILSARISQFIACLKARDLQSVLKFREEFKEDLKGVLTAFVSTKQSISEMARATRLMSTSLGRRALFSTLAIDLLFEDSKVILEGFHPQDTSISVIYLLDGLFFSAVASEADNAALTLGLRLYGHGLRLATPAWGSAEVLKFPSLDARGVQWVESIGLPTLLKVTAEPLRNSTSVQGLRHILFTVSGLMAFQNLPANTADARVHDSPRTSSLDPELQSEEDSDPVPGTPLTRSFAAWERTKGVRMELSIRPMSLSLVSGPIVALFHLQAVIGTFEWNKLVEKGVQLRTAINAPRVSLSFMRMPSAEFTVEEIKPEDDRSSLSVVMERSRVDVLKSQEDLQHMFIFRVEVYSVSGKLHPWRVLRDAATWADEQEIVSDLQVVHYNSLSTNRQRLPKPVHPNKQTEHRLILAGFNVQRLKLAVPLLGSEEYSSSRLALSATDLHLFARQRFENPNISIRNVIEVKSDFIGVFWERSWVLSSHHARIVLAINHNSREGLSLFGPTSVVIVPGTWMIHPRKDFIMAIIEAKNMKEYKNFSEKMISRPDTSRPESSVAGDSLSILTEQQDRLLFESLSLKITRTSGFIEGLGDSQDELFAKQSGPPDADLVSKLSIPTFSIAFAREVSHDFDLIDVDFSGREGEFPRGCIQRVSNLFAELFGAVVGEQEMQQNDFHTQDTTNPTSGRKVSREVSVLIRFGESLYRAQEEANLSFESTFGFFAGQHSAILLSVATVPIFGEEEIHTTVYTGISPDLKLEITPLLEGAKPQSLRLSSARMLHAISPYLAPHSVFHIPRVTAMMDAKTVLLTQRRHRLRSSVLSGMRTNENSNSVVPAFEKSEMNALVALGGAKLTDDTTPQDRSTSFIPHQSTSAKPENDASEKEEPNVLSTETETRTDPDIRLQLKFDAAPHAKASRMDVFIHRVLFGVSHCARIANTSTCPSVASYAILHQGMVRARWDFLSCNLSLKENMMYKMKSKISSAIQNWTSVGNIINRLKFDILRYETHTMRLNVDALAMNCFALPYAVVFESTDIRTEVSHTLIQAIARLLGLIKKLGNEVRLLSERDIAKGSKPVGNLDRTVKNNVVPSINEYDESLSDAREDAQTEMSAHLTSEAFANVLRVRSETLLLPDGTSISMKGRSMVLVLRGYQFEERRHHATISLSNYDLRHNHWVVADNASNPQKERMLELNFDVMKLSYKDDERQILSELCKIPDPALVLRIWDMLESLKVRLEGHLDIKLGSGFYNWRHFRDLAVLTLYGIDVGPNFEESAQRAEEPSSARDIDHWNGRVPEVTVDLNPRIDVIGDFTSDLLYRMENRLGNGEEIPGYMYHHMVLPLEALAKLLCDPLVQRRVSNKIS